MNTRILQSIWKLKRTSCMTMSSFSYRNIMSPHYAMAISGTNTFHPKTINTPLIIARLLLNGRSFALNAASSVLNTPSAERLIRRMDGYYERNGLVNYDLFCKLMDILEQNMNVYNQLLTADQTEFLLSACGSLMPAQTPAQRMLLFQRLWYYLETHSQLRDKHFFAALEVRRINRTTLPDYRAFLQKVRNHNEELLNSHLYEMLVAMACESGNITQANEMLAEMREQEMTLSEPIFNSLIVAHSRCADIGSCKKVLADMQEANLSISSETQTVLICAHLENQQTEQAIEMRQQFQGQFNERQLLRMLKAAAELSGQAGLELMEQWLRELPQELLLGSEVTKPIRSVCIELVHNGKIDAAVALVRNLPTPHFSQNNNLDTFGVFLLVELYRAHLDAPKIIEICNMLVESGKNTRALHVAAEIASHQSPPKALPILEHIAQQEALRPHYFWPLLMYNYRRWGESGIMQTLRTISGYNVECDNETILNYVLPHLPVTLEDPELALRQLSEAGVTTAHVYTPIMGHILAQRKLELAHKLTQLYPTKLDCMQLVQPLAQNLTLAPSNKNNHQQFVELLKAFQSKAAKPNTDFVGQVLLEIVANNTRNNAASLLQCLLEEMQNASLQISPAAAELIVEHLRKLRENSVNCDETKFEEIVNGMTNDELTLPTTEYNAGGTTAAAAAPASIYRHPRDMTRDEMECHLVELESKGMNARGVLRRLLQLSVRDGCLQRALELKHKCDQLNVRISPGMLASIFDMYTKLKDSSKAEETLRQLKISFPGFQVDEHKFIDYAALLVQEQKLDAAKALLRERSTICQIVGGDYVLKNIWNLLTNVAKLGASCGNLAPEENLTRDTFLFLHQLRYCSANNIVLGPIVREYLLRHNVHAAVAEVKQLAELYKHTPLQYELMSLLVRLSNASSDADAAEELQRYGVTLEEAKDLLTTVTDVVKQTHGAVNMNSTLLLAFAHCGTEQQLRRLLLNPEFRVNQDALLRNCTHLGQGGDWQTLLRLARCVRGLNHVISEHTIYEILMTHFKNANNYTAALELFTKLEADDELKISQQLLRNLVDILRINNVELPSSLALRAQIL